MPQQLTIAAVLSCMFVGKCVADVLPVTNNAEFSAALTAAQPGDTISIAPGLYGGGYFRSGLSDVIIQGADPANRPVIRGGIAGIQLSDANRVTLEHLVFEQQTGNGLNIDDGGSFATPSTDIVIRNVLVRDIAGGGNLDGIKLSGVTGFLIENVVVDNWGSGGSAIDPVGSHNGLIQNSLFRHSTGGSSGIRPKGGSKNIVVRANRFEMADSGRAIQAGGSTGSQFFRFIDGDSGYEAADITAHGNVVIGASSAFSYVNIDGGHFHHNRIERPDDWAVRILNENPGTAIIDTQNGRFTDNVVVFNDTSAEWNRAVNVGPETLPATYEFARNRWFNLADATPQGSTPQLPAPETDGVYGQAPDFSVNEPIIWDFAWGKWIVNATEQPGSLDGDVGAGLRLAVSGVGGRFEPLLAQPLAGDWTLGEVPGQIQLPPLSQVILINVDAFQSSVIGDYDGDQLVGMADYLLWQSQFGSLGLRAADGNGDGVVNAADYTVWRDAFEQATVAVPEPSTLTLSALVLISVWRRRCSVI